MLRAIANVIAIRGFFENRTLLVNEGINVDFNGPFLGINQQINVYRVRKLYKENCKAGCTRERMGSISNLMKECKWKIFNDRYSNRNFSSQPIFISISYSR